MPVTCIRTTQNTTLRMCMCMTAFICIIIRNSILNWIESISIMKWFFMTPRALEVVVVVVVVVCGYCWWTEYCRVVQIPYDCITIKIVMYGRPGCPFLNSYKCKYEAAGFKHQTCSVSSYNYMLRNSTLYLLSKMLIYHLTHSLCVISIHNTPTHCHTLILSAHNIRPFIHSQSCNENAYEIKFIFLSMIQSRIRKCTQRIL